jgi:site-specific recombinase XerD
MQGHHTGGLKMARKVKNQFLKHLREYFNVFLPRQKNCSIHTINSSSQTWNLLLKHVSATRKVNPEKITFSMLNRAMVVGFLDTMETKRAWKPATINQRLSCIRSFFHYAAGMEASLSIYADDLSRIPLKKTINTSRIVEFMSRDAMKVFLHQPDTDTRIGIRDQFFMSLMYDTAARNCEMLSMKLADFNEDDKSVYLLGKGAKPRLVPVTAKTVLLFQRYKSSFHQAGKGNDPMFYVRRRGKKMSMSDDNVARFIKKYSATARAACSEIPERVHPHMFRRSRAMHLYRSGMPLALLSEWLGHENPETTLIYAYSDTEMKREAIEKADNQDSVLETLQEKAVWENNEDILQKLCGFQ